jgi:hypothetical protein
MLGAGLARKRRWHGEYVRFSRPPSNGNYTTFMSDCAQCRHLGSRYAQAAQQQLAQYRTSGVPAFPSLWAQCMEALAVSRTVRDEMLWHVALHTAPSRESARAAQGS